MTAIASIKCKNCGNDLWEDDFNGMFECTNCLFKRSYVERKPKPHVITPSQQKTMNKIKAYLLNTFSGKEYGIEEESIQTTTYGKVIYQVSTGGNIFIKQGGSFFIGSKGKIDVSWLEFATDEGLLKQGIK